MIARLGIDTDTRIARALGITISAVAQRRRALGIGRSPRAQLEGRAWTRTEDRLLGMMSDREVAEEIGVSLASVERRRLALRIPAFHMKGAVRKLERLAGARYIQAYREGVTISGIAREHEVDRSSVSKALQRYQRRLFEASQRATRAQRHKKA